VADTRKLFRQDLQDLFCLSSRKAKNFSLAGYVFTLSSGKSENIILKIPGLDLAERSSAHYCAFYKNCFYLINKKYHAMAGLLILSNK
jgi:hypothetical protein